MNIIGTGVDIVETSRIASSLARHGDRFLARVFLEGERAYCGKMATPEQCYAARFAAKEAVSKAFGTGIGASLAGWTSKCAAKPAANPSSSSTAKASKPPRASASPNCASV